jgi:L-ascorbate metabolism protein UlaG (beta-lactamase superfamily)
MELIARLYSPEVVILPIGGVFTMDPFQAAEAVAMMNPRIVVPCHFASFPVLAESADEFVGLCREKAPRTKVEVLTPGESLSLG